MKWQVTGAWKTDGKDASIVVDARDKAEAEKIASAWGLVTESVTPQAVGNGMPIEEAYGLTRRMSTWAIIIGLFLSPMIFGVPLLVWGIVAMAKMNRMQVQAHQSAATAKPNP